ncbi:YkgJ family cysteine cluster protein [Pseudomonas syringae group genomosp. 3]|uniref:YkgJ family cysteine cluster protein n=1 Tax=Pseudomonas syringae group genomosp. 3 TaxID=251701 RepID=UPI000EFE3330|nr:YkgJ family cysteine cluster protein [Pseudomonas syringae group genomosp. 3]
MDNPAIRFACNGCGVCCKGRLIPLTLREARQWLHRGHDVAVVLEAFDQTTWPPGSPQYAHSFLRGAEVSSGSTYVTVVAVFTGNAISQSPNLGDDDRCGIYHERPLVCRIYPVEINPFIPMEPESKACPPQVWEAGEVIFTDRIIDPVLERQVQESRSADRADALAKVAVCESLGLKVAAWKGNALAVYQPDRIKLIEAIDAYDSGIGTRLTAGWRVRVDNLDLINKLQRAGVALEAGGQQEYIFQEL